jgi:hypothetical protein
MHNTVRLRITDQTETFFLEEESKSSGNAEQTPIQFHSDQLGYMLCQILDLDTDAVQHTLAEYQLSVEPDQRTIATNSDLVYSSLVAISEVFKLYAHEEAHTIIENFLEGSPTVSYLVSRLKCYIAYCNKHQLPLRNNFYTFLIDHGYFGVDCEAFFDDRLPEVEDYFRNCAKDPEKLDDMDAHYVYYLKETEATNLTVPRSYFFSRYTNRITQTALASFQEISERGKVIRKCANCGKYFLPENRSDTMYCDKISPQDPKMDCKTYASQRLWYQKQKKDELAVLSRNILSAKGMLAKRNPDIPAYQQSYDYFRTERMKWKKAVESGEVTRDAYQEWLLHMQEQKIIKEASDGID